MYKIYADDVLIYDDTSPDPYVKVASPKLTVEKNAAGSLKMTIPPGNAGYDYIVRMITEIKVEKDGYEYWSGRVIQEDKDFWNNRTLTCEGELAYLNDTTQPQEHYSFSGTPIRLYFEALLDEHNEHAPVDKQFEVGYVDSNLEPDRLELDTNYETTIECINKIIDEYGGFIQIRKQGGVRYLDYWKTEPGTSSQTIEFGKNLIDFTSSFDSTEYATVVVPLGAKIEQEDSDLPDSYLTVEGATVEGADGTRFVKLSQDIIDIYGWIEVVVHFDDIDDANELYYLGKRYLEDIQYDTMEINLTALDLHYLNPDIEDVKLGDMIRVISTPHGIDHDFAVTKLDISLDQPQNTTFQLGDNVKTSLTSATNRVNAEILEKLREGLDIEADAILEAAKANTNALMNMTLNGYVTLLTEEDESGRHSEGLYISHSMPLKDDQGNFVAQRFWKWSSTGLGYTDDGGQTWKVAMTMDGSIVGDRIAAGTIHGSKITAGSLALTTSAGQESCTISLAVLGLPGDALEIGDIDGNNGANMESTVAARSIIKYRITSGTTVSAGNYYFSLYQYSNNDTVESGFVTATGFSKNEYTVTTTAWYRIVLMKAISGTEVVTEDLAPMAAAIRIGDSSTVITSADIRINGMVTFAALSEPNRTTVINGDYIKTGSVKANYIDLKGITVTSTKKGGQTVPEYTSFAVDQNGEVTINGNVTLGPGTTISWAQVLNNDGSKSVEDIDYAATTASADASTAKTNSENALNNVRLLAVGAYSPELDQEYPDAFINQRHIYAPEISGGIISASIFTGLAAGQKADLTSGIRVANAIEIVETSGENWTTKGWVGLVTGNDGTSQTSGVGLSSYNIGSSSESDYNYGGKIMLTNAGSLFDYSESYIFGRAAGASILAHVATSGGYDYGEIKMQTYEWDTGSGTYGSSELTFSRGRLKTGVLVLGSDSYGTESKRLSLSPVEGQIFFQID